MFYRMLHNSNQAFWLNEVAELKFDGGALSAEIDAQ
jgi:hypothetical protein